MGVREMWELLFVVVGCVMVGEKKGGWCFGVAFLGKKKIEGLRERIKVWAGGGKELANGGQDEWKICGSGDGGGAV